MTGIADGQREGWSSDAIVFRLAVGGVAAIAFIFWELHTPRAMIDIRIFANLEFSAAAHDRLHLRRRHDGLDLRHARCSCRPSSASRRCWPG